MPSFDIVSQVDMQEVDNAVNSVVREITQRYDFKGSNSSVERVEADITIMAGDDYKLNQIQEMLKVHFTRRKIDSKALEFGEEEKASGNMIRQKVTVVQGIETDIAKKIVKEIKGTKIKVQAAIRGQEVRVDGKKRDDLQQVITYIKELDLDVPLQYINFRD